MHAYGHENPLILDLHADTVPSSPRPLLPILQGQNGSTALGYELCEHMRVVLYPLIAHLRRVPATQRRAGGAVSGRAPYRFTSHLSLVLVQFLLQIPGCS